MAAKKQKTSATKKRKNDLNSKRVESFRERAKANGWLRKEYYVTEEEHEALKAHLAAMRR